MGKKAAVAKEKLTYRQQRAEGILRHHRDAQGQLRHDLWHIGVEHVRRMKVAAALPTPQPRRGRAPAAVVFAGVQWSQVGPAPIRIDPDPADPLKQFHIFQGVGPVAGEVTGIAIDPTGTTDQTIYVSTNDGGIWKSTDGGASWNPKTENMPSLSVGAVALDPANPSSVYVGTGNEFDGGGVLPNPNIGSSFAKGVGVYKSTDAGETWAIVGGAVFAGLAITDIVLPATNVLLVATNNGLFRSIDGGANFGNNAPQFNNGLAVQPGSISCLSLDTATPTTVYTGVRGSGLFVSKDSGATFPANLFANPGGPTGSFDYIAFSQSVSNSQVMYASVDDPSATPPYKGLFKSRNGGQNWDPPSASAAARAAEHKGLQAGYDVTVGVDPRDENRVYIGFQEVYLSTDGGTNFGTPAVSQAQIHWDQHATVFSPPSHTSAAPSKVYVATDGGVSTSADGGINWTNLNEGVATSLFMGIDIGRGSPANNQFTIGGLQDCGTVEHQAGFAGADWHLAIDGDGGRVAVDPSNPMRAYGVDDGSFIVTSNGGTTWSTPGQPLPVTNPPLANILAFITVIDPNNSANVYVSEATNAGFAPGPRLFKSTNSATNFSLLQTFPANITALAMTPLNSDVVWVGLSNGTAQISTNGGTSWTPIAVDNAPANPISGVATDPTDANTVVAIYTGFTTLPATSRTKHVFRSTNNGAAGSWNDISGTDNGNPDANLADLPLHSVVIDGSVNPHRIIVASDSGVMQSGDNGATWQVLGVGLPAVDCLSLAFDGSAAPPLLRVGTYGRSVFELTRPSAQTIAVISNLAFGAVALGSSATQSVRVFNAGAAVLTISAFSLSSGSADFQLVTPPAFPLSVNPGTEVDFTVQFHPSVAGNQAANFQIASDDPSRPALNVNASGSTPFPLVSTISPTNGNAAGGDTITITGSAFTGATAVNFGANAGGGLVVNSDTQITIVSPAGAPGAVDITVVTPAGTSATSAADLFTYNPAAVVPTVTAISPTNGNAAGGDTITITGSAFTGATAVNFGANAGSGLVVNSDTQITIVSPAGAPGAVDITVVTPAGTSATSAADLFTYA